MTRSNGITTFCITNSSINQVTNCQQIITEGSLGMSFNQAIELVLLKISWCSGKIKILLQVARAGPEAPSYVGLQITPLLV